MQNRISNDSPFSKEDLKKGDYTCASNEVIDTSPYNKYKNKRTEVGGIVFSSKKEAGYYSELLLLKSVGEVVDIKCQVPFVLQDGYVWKGMKIRPITYIADFQVTYKDGTIEIIDTKGFITQIYRIKKKMLLYRYPNLIFKEI